MDPKINVNNNNDSNIININNHNKNNNYWARKIDFCRVLYEMQFNKIKIISQLPQKFA